MYVYSPMWRQSNVQTVETLPPHMLSASERRPCGVREIELEHTSAFNVILSSLQ